MARAKKPEIPFEDYLMLLTPEAIPQVEALHHTMLQHGCTVKLEPSKSGYVVSYRDKRSNKVVANFVNRKKGPMLRLYADHVMQYSGLVEALPPAMVKAVEKAPVCRRLVNPELCSPHCPKGYEFLLHGQPQQKCRYNCFLMLLTEDTTPHLKTLLERELACRAA